MKHALPCALAFSALALPLSACGGSGGDTANASDTAAERDAAQVRLQQCLRKQGAELPRPGGGGGPTMVRPSAAERRKVQNALEGPCKKYRDKAFGDFSEEDRQEMQDRMAKFSACMRKEGVDVPDFRPGSGEVQGFRANRESPRFRKAQEKCRAGEQRGDGHGRGSVPGMLRDYTPGPVAGKAIRSISRRGRSRRRGRS